MKEKDDISREIESIQTIMEKIRFEEGKEEEELTSNISFKCLSKIEIKTLNYCFCNSLEILNKTNSIGKNTKRNLSSWLDR